MISRRILALLAVLVFCFAAPEPTQARDDDFVSNLINYTARFRNGDTVRRETITQCRPGQLR